MTREPAEPTDWGQDRIFVADKVGRVSPEAEIADAVELARLSDWPSPRELFRTFHQRRFFRPAALVGFMAGVVVAVNHNLQEDQERLERSQQPIFINCPAPSPKALGQTSNLLRRDNPESPRIISARRFGLHDNNDINLDTYNLRYFPGLPADNLRRAQYITKKYGIKLQVGNVQSQIEGMRAPTLKEVKRRMLPSLLAITEPMETLPKEIVSESGIRKILLVSSSTSKSYYEFEDDDTLLWNIKLKPGRRVLADALYNGIDGQECADANTDKGYERLNNRRFIYKKTDRPQDLTAIDDYAYPETGEDYSASSVSVSEHQFRYDQPYYDAMQEAGLTGDYDEACDLIKTEQHKIVVASPDGFNDPNRDKISLGAMIVDSFGEGQYDVLRRGSPTIKAKARYLLARLFESQPNLVRYYAAKYEAHSGFSPKCK